MTKAKPEMALRGRSVLRLARRATQNLPENLPKRLLAALQAQ
jgi:hypothetical protein